MCVPEVSILTGEDCLLGLAGGEATKAAEIDREYTASTSSSSLAESGAQEVVNVLLSPDGNYVQVNPYTEP